MKEKNDRENNLATKKWESASHISKNTKPVPAFKRLNTPVDSVGTIYAIRHALKKLNCSTHIYILNATAILCPLHSVEQ